MIRRDQRYSFSKGLPRKVLQSPLFLLRYQKNNVNDFRVAVVVSKKVSKKSVERHRVKRIFIEEFKKACNEKGVAYDLVFFLRPTIREKSHEAVYNEIGHVVSKL